MLRNTKVIDLVISCDDGTWELALVVESGEWKQHGALYALQEKLNTYSSYALDGAMSASYPESEGADKVILIQTIDVPPEQAVQFLTNGLPKERRTFGEPPHSLSKCNQKAARREPCMVRFKQAH